MKENLSIMEMLKMQQDLWEKHSAEFPPLSPQYGKESILWMVGEIGECISIIKKREILQLLKMLLLELLL